jgi:hypothetical protein
MGGQKFLQTFFSDLRKSQELIEKVQNLDTFSQNFDGRG